jgi:XTP/dITP diphosphohydrolase
MPRILTYDKKNHILWIPKSAIDNSQFSILNSQLKKELGDLAMHILFYCKIAEEEGLFTTADVYNAICDKLISRHPFIYDKENYHGEDWEQLKMREGRKNVLEGVPDSLPSLVKAIRMQEKVKGESGKVKGEIADAEQEPLTLHLSPFTSEEQFGELLFSLVDWGRRHGINADDALCLANRRFKEQHSC